jgi:heme/copper-type cytochrome/quinol oxidase subunit 2
MSLRGWRKFGLLLTATAVALLVLCAPAWAQCAMCKATTTALDAAAARRLNAAILLMVSPPVALFGTFIYLTYKHRRPPGDDD